VKAPAKAAKPAEAAAPVEAAPAPAATPAPVAAKKVVKPAKPKPVKAEKVEKAEKPAKQPKAKAEKPAKVVREKVVRDSFSMPKSEHAQLKALRETLAKAGRICTKSELLRAGVQLLLKESTASTKALVEGLVVVPKGKGAK
jgi:Arc/MetJ-type ribon-helix-helix transcriptional regulator